ncbi:class I SAM-dependent methyltransferase [Candidatus Halobonum tyrrellensis]|uniref:Type 11 methyltransferase n=1 Tax=Candidatus Halobonum tyrrellensis G22 TaxID=1324957 RepID=V4HKT1_9EURY|nr:methyltransferase domain-containing protein [Candidatus Halobonum tyrrellensis]ESP88534.1 type 11 methyltransferase [Candidatus Halobonum tyrrellensis G22]
MAYPFSYYFGVSDARRHGRRVAVGVGVALAGLAAGTLVATRPAFLVGLVAVFVGLWYARPALARLLVPAPWQPEAWRYAPLRHALDPEGADRWLDVGTDTGRSLVGVATAGAAPPDDTPPDPETDRAAALAGVRVTAVDAFGTTLRGDAARLAERNAAAAGLDAAAVRGTADCLPVRADSQDVVTMCGALSDLTDGAERAVAEARRVVCDDGRVGVLEPVEGGGPSVGTGGDDPLDRWASLLADGGFDVTASGAVSRAGSRYVYLVVEPA